MKDKDVNSDYEYRTQLQNLISDQQKVLDRNLIIISAGVFTISNTFTTSLFEPMTSQNSCMLITSWISFGSCILITICSQFISQIALNRHLNEWDEHISKKREEVPGCKGNRLISACNFIAFFLFFSGFLFHFWYIIINFKEVLK
jgi:hypothetical protein